MNNPAQYVYRYISIEGLLADNIEIGDDNQASEAMQSFGSTDYILSVLTHRQKSVAEMLSDGHDRREIARFLGVSLQAVNQIVIRMQKRIREKVEVPDWARDHAERADEVTYKGIVFIMKRIIPKCSPDVLYRLWDIHKVLKDYRKPTIDKLNQWFNEV